MTWDEWNWKKRERKNKIKKNGWERKENTYIKRWDEKNRYLNFIIKRISGLSSIRLLSHSLDVCNNIKCEICCHLFDPYYNISYKMIWKIFFFSPSSLLLSLSLPFALLGIEIFLHLFLRDMDHLFFFGMRRKFNCLFRDVNDIFLFFLKKKKVLFSFPHYLLIKLPLCGGDDEEKRERTFHTFNLRIAELFQFKMILFSSCLHSHF